MSQGKDRHQHSLEVEREQLRCRGARYDSPVYGGWEYLLGRRTPHPHPLLSLARESQDAGGDRTWSINDGDEIAGQVTQ